MNRRRLLTLAAAAPLVVAGRAFAVPRQPVRLLVVFLRGGYDAASLLVPISSDFYYRSRPTIAIPRPDPANPNTAIPLTAEWGLHPALRGSILPLWNRGQAAFAPFTGTDDLTRSHFETQDTIELGQPIQGSRDYRSGFMGRLAGGLAGADPKGYLSGRLAELGRGLAAYVEELGPDAWNDTVVVVVSEFGRTFRENGDKGADHGHGSVYWILGGSIRGGRILGDHGPVTEASLNQNRDYPVLIDYRGLLGGLFQRLYGLDSARLQSVFPGAPALDLGLV